METSNIFLLQAGYVALTLICLSFVLFGVRKVYAKTGVPAAQATRRMLTVTAAVTGWLLLLSILSAAGVFSDFTSMPPKMLLAILVPLLFILWLTFSSSTKSFLKAVPPQWLIYFQVFRVPVEVLLWIQFLEGLTPVQMTFEGRNWDVLTGLTAPLFAYLCYGQGRSLRGLAALWHLCGLALVLNIVVISVLSAPVPFRVFMNEPANTIVAEFPVIFLPGVLVPLAYGMHLLGLRKAFMARRTEETPGYTPTGVSQGSIN